MEMKSKYNVGDILYGIDNLKIVKIEVSSISIVTTKEYTHVYYHRDGGYWKSHTNLTHPGKVF